MDLQTIEGDFSICRLRDADGLRLDEPFCFAARTDGELSLVCPTARIPPSACQIESGWRAFRIAGTLDFSLTGILAGISAVLANNNIGLFAVSTFDTDYFLVKRQDFNQALSALEQAGYRFLP